MYCKIYWEKAYFSSVLGNVLGFHIFKISCLLSENCSDFMYLFPDNINFDLWVLVNIIYFDVLGFGIDMYWYVLEFEKIFAATL